MADSKKSTTRKGKFLREAKKKAFVAALEADKYGDVTTAAKVAGISASTAYGWRKKDLDFAKAWDYAITHVYEALFKAASKRASEGVEDYVVHDGRIVVHHWGCEPKPSANGRYCEDDCDGRPLIRRKYSDSLVRGLLQARDPLDRHREKQTVQHEGEGGVLVVPGKISVEDWEKCAAEHFEKSSA